MIAPLREFPNVKFPTHSCGLKYSGSSSLFRGDYPQAVGSVAVSNFGWSNVLQSHFQREMSPVFRQCPMSGFRGYRALLLHPSRQETWGVMISDADNMLGDKNGTFCISIFDFSKFFNTQNSTHLTLAKFTKLWHTDRQKVMEKSQPGMHIPWVDQNIFNV